MTTELSEFETAYQHKLGQRRSEFIRCLDHVETVANNLVHHKVFTQEEKKSVMSRFGKPNQKEALFELLLTKGFAKIDCIIAAVDSKLNQTVVILLRNIKMTSLVSPPSDLILETPTLDPPSERSASASPTKNSNDGGILSCLEPQEKNEPYSQWPESSPLKGRQIKGLDDISKAYEVYFNEINELNQLESYNKLEGKRYAFVMSNINFYNRGHNRTYWGREDAYQVWGLLTACDFQVTHIEDCAANDFKQPTGRFCQWRNCVLSQPKPAAIIVVLMTHGNAKEEMLMCDGKWISYRQHVFDKFSNTDENKNLQGVPKLFFLQCCRGNNYNYIESKEDYIVADNKVESIFSDMLIVYSALPEFTCERGWLMSGLSETIRKFGQVGSSDDVITILMKVNAALRRLREKKSVPKSKLVGGARPGENIWVDHKHVCPFENIAFTKKFYFEYDKDKEETWHKHQQG